MLLLIKEKDKNAKAAPVKSEFLSHTERNSEIEYISQ